MAELPDNRSRLTRWIAASLLPLALGLFVGHFAIQVFDRFYQNDSLRAFYAPGTDATCWVYKLRGEQTMSCLPGDHRTEEDAADE